MTLSSALKGRAGPLMLPVLLLFVLAAAAAAAPPGPPDLDLAKWNQAYKITVANITRQQMIM